MTEHFRKAMTDFLDQEFIVFVPISESKNRDEPTYVPQKGGAIMKVLKHGERREDKAATLHTATHEIGHFVTCDLARISKIDYGFSTFDPTTKWSARMVEAELAVFAVQAVIYKANRRHETARKVMRDGLDFAIRSEDYVRSIPCLRTVAEFQYGTSFQKFYQVFWPYARETAERKIEEAPKYYEIVREFNHRAKILANNMTPVAA